MYNLQIHTNTYIYIVRSIFEFLILKLSWIAEREKITPVQNYIALKRIQNIFAWNTSWIETVVNYNKRYIRAILYSFSALWEWEHRTENKYIDGDARAASLECAIVHWTTFLPTFLQTVLKYTWFSRVFVLRMSFVRQATRPTAKV